MNVKVTGACKSIEKLTRTLRLIRVGHRDRNVLNIKFNHKTVHDDHENRHRQCEKERVGVSQNMVNLLLGNCGGSTKMKGVHVYFPSTRLMKTSSSDGRTSWI